MKTIALYIATLLGLLSIPGIGHADGELLFQNNCMACHQSDGKGIPQVYPALAGSEVVRGSAQDVVLVLLVGRGDMPVFKDSLTDLEMADIVNFVRNAWGNQGQLISETEVGQIRARGF